MQIPFIVAGNERNWSMPNGEGKGGELLDGKDAVKGKKCARKFKLTKWTFSEAQCGKDELDTHFSYIRQNFEKWKGLPDGALEKGTDMYAALTYDEHALKNTNVILVNTTHSALKKKFKLPTLGIQSVHEYTYLDLGKGVTKVEVAHHGGINAGSKTRWSMTTEDDKYTKWVREAEFKVQRMSPYECHPCIPDHNSRADAPYKGRMFKSQMQAVTSYRKVILETARDWSQHEAEIQKEQDKDTLKLPELPETKEIRLKTKGWMTKKSTPAIQTPLAIRKVLVRHFNQRNPHMSPDESRDHLLAMDEYRNDIFVQYFMTPARIKQFFGKLLKYKKDKKIPTNEDVGEEAAGMESSSGSGEYKNIRGVQALRMEIRSRNLVVHRLSTMKKADLIAVLKQNDKDLLEGCGDGEAEEAVDVQYATEEAGKGGLDPESATMEFVDGDDDDGVEVLIDALMQDDAGLNDVDEIHGTGIMTPVS